MKYTKKAVREIVNHVIQTLRNDESKDDIFNNHIQTYDPDEVALICNKNPQTIRKHLRLKKLLGHKAGGAWIISEEALNQYIGKNG